jgi:hypothetical protein
MFEFLKAYDLAAEFGYSVRAVQLCLLVGQQIQDDSDPEPVCDGKEWSCRPHRSGQARTEAAWKSKWSNYMTRDADVM